MKKPNNIYRVFILFAGIFVISCGGSKTVKVDSNETKAQSQERAISFDPFELPRDKEIIPAKHPKSSEIITQLTISKAGSAGEDSLSYKITGVPDSYDTLNSQVFRVQLFTSKLYGEARKEAKIAEEIFDRPVFIDYEVPYFKVRVGNFNKRDDAEDYQQAAKTSGYTSAWVVLVNIKIKETKPLYEDGYEPPDDDSINSEDSVVVDDSLQDDE